MADRTDMVKVWFFIVLGIDILAIGSFIAILNSQGYFG